jgi:predicted nucleotide-binding protein
MPASLVVQYDPEPIPANGRDVRSLGRFVLRERAVHGREVRRFLWVVGSLWKGALDRTGNDEARARGWLVRVAFERLRDQLGSGATLDDLGAEEVINSTHMAGRSPDEGDKVCQFQIPGRRGLQCDASMDDDPLEGRTTLPLCNACDLPGDPVRCSALTHIGVRDRGTMGPEHRQVWDAMCEAGYGDRARQTHLCRLAGHDCWRQEWPVAVMDPQAASTEEAAVAAATEVFLVHGHDHARLRDVESFLRRSGVPVRVLMDEPNLGRTLVEKFEQEGTARYAVVLLTGDDEGRARADGPEAPLKRRGRQNAILELGYFMGSLGRGRVAVLVEDEPGNRVERPSDIDGLCYISFAGQWQWDLARELRAAGFNL